ncbi:urea transporter [Paenibacillus woosongensis]|uniref:Urea transporter n=1 Tax=Paenibacillus woosongensis TaxID=307580 RepID=A0AA95I7L4_9BACL|nr:urea transporter [Paenibacillus woosongensis]WHX49003.1 urea transporter [Paenibacillus woosongensis]
MLIENAATGLIVLAAIVISSYPLGLIALACSVIGTWIGYSGGKNRATGARGAKIDGAMDGSASACGSAKTGTDGTGWNI